MSNSNPRRPNFPYSPTRAEPDFDVIASTPAPPTRRLTTSAATVKRAKAIQNFLRSVRSGVTSDRYFDGILVLDRVTTYDGTTFYHLSDEARSILTDAWALPWGA